MHPKIVLISGKQGSGKSTLANLLAEKARFSFNTVYFYNFADAIYQFHDTLRLEMSRYGLETPDHLQVKDGALLQFLGTEWGRKTYGEDVWVNILKNKVKKFGGNRDLVIVADVRFENEFNAFESALKVRLECDRDIRKARCSQWRQNETHPSETSLDQYAADGKFDLTFNSLEMSPNEIANFILDEL